MTPRKYTKAKRQAAAEALRQRILEATLRLHAEKGIFGTSWKDIAQQADVSLATVYNYFPSLDELVPACGELMYAITRPPSLEDSPMIFAGARSLKARLGRLVSALFDFYERGAPYLETDYQERKLASVQAWEAHLKATIEGLTRAALEPVQPDERAVQTVSALLDFRVFMAFQRRGLPKGEVDLVISRMLLGWIRQSNGRRQNR